MSAVNSNAGHELIAALAVMQLVDEGRVVLDACRRLVWWPDVALSSPFVAPLTLTISIAAWTAVLLTVSAAWNAARAAGHASLTHTAFEVLLVVPLVVLGIFSLYWASRRGDIEPLAQQPDLFTSGAIVDITASPDRADVASCYLQTIVQTSQK